MSAYSGGAQALILSNNQYLQGKDSSGTVHNIIGINSSNIIEVDTDALGVKFDGAVTIQGVLTLNNATITVGANITFNGGAGHSITFLPQNAGNNWSFTNALQAALVPSGDNVQNLAASGNRINTAYIVTSHSGASNYNFQNNNFSASLTTGGAFIPGTDNAVTNGGPGNRWSITYTLGINAGAAASVYLANANYTYTFGTAITTNGNNNNDIGATGNTFANLWLGGGLSKIKGIATAGWTVPAIYAASRSAAVTNAASGTVVTYTPTADGTFVVSANVLVTTSTTHNFTVTCSYTDEGNTARVLTFTFSNIGGTLLTAIINTGGAVPYEGVPLHIRVKANTAITIQSAAGGTYTNVVYNIDAAIRQLA